MYRNFADSSSPLNFEVVATTTTHFVETATHNRLTSSALEAQKCPCIQCSQWQIEALPVDAVVLVVVFVVVVATSKLDSRKTQSVHSRRPKPHTTTTSFSSIENNSGASETRDSPSVKPSVAWCIYVELFVEVHGFLLEPLEVLIRRLEVDTFQLSLNRKHSLSFGDP